MNVLKKIFTLDARSLALFRILVGFIVASDAVWKLYWSRDFYTDWGIFPRFYWIENYMNAYKFSFHLASGQWGFQILLFAIHILAAICFMIGFRTKIAGFVAWVLLCSMQSRNYLILSSGDDVLRMALFWALFVPVSSRFAVEQKEHPPLNWKYHVSIAALMLQILYVYIFTALFKNHPIWMKEFSAVYYALNIDIFTTGFGEWLRQFPLIMQALTFGTILLEYVGPAVALVPGWIRFIGSLSFISFHFGLFTTMYLGFFPWISMAYWTAFWPKEVWQTNVGQKCETTLDRLFQRLRGLFASSQTLQSPFLNRLNRSCAKEVVLIFCAVLTFLVNLSGLSIPDGAMKTVITRLGWISYVNQEWSMFAPYPIKNDGWFVVTAAFKGGQSGFDVLTGQPVNYEKPADPSDSYTSSEWRKLMLNVWDKGDRKILLPFARYLCRKYSKENGYFDDITTFKIEYVKETTPPPGEPFPPTEVKTLWNHDCFLKVP